MRGITLVLWWKRAKAGYLFFTHVQSTQKQLRSRLKIERLVFLCLSKVYRIKGYEKKLMSDKYIEIEEDGPAAYEMKLLYRSKSKVVVHFGFASFDEYKNAISPLQVCMS
jgi:hypothetical protein